MKHRNSAIAVLLLAILLLAGCGGTNQFSGPPTLVYGTATTGAGTPGSATTGGKTLQIVRFSGRVTALDWSPDGTRVAAMVTRANGFAAKLQVWDASSGQLLFTYDEMTALWCCLAWSPDGRRIALAAYPASFSGSNVLVLDAATGALLLAFDQNSPSMVNLVQALAWSPSGDQIETLEFTGPPGSVTHPYSPTTVAQRWDASTGKLVATSPAPLQSDTINAVAWSPDGKEIAASAGNDSAVEVWDMATGKVLLTYRGHSAIVYALAWSPDGRFLASGSGDTTVQVWDAATGKLAYTYRGHANEVHALAWSPDGQRIVSGSGYSSIGPEDHPVQVFDAFTGQQPFSYADQSDPATALAWSPDGSEIASAGASLTGDAVIRIWTPPPEG